MSVVNVDTLLIDKPIRGTMFDSITGKRLFSVDMIKDPTLECSGTVVYADDHLGAHIASFTRAKEATFSASNAQFNIDLAAAQYGTEREVAGEDSTMIIPVYEELVVGLNVNDPNTTVALTFDPEGTVAWIYKVSKAQHSVAYPVAIEASATEFSINGKTITLPTGAFEGTDKVGVWYEYATETAVKITNSSDAYAKKGRFDLEVIMVNPCNKDTKYYAHIVFPNAQLMDDVSINFNTEGNHPFSLQAIQEYCDDRTSLFSIIVPEVVEEE
jgi:hypothetical protein